MRLTSTFVLTLSLLASAPRTVHATDTDPLDCGRTITDFGDAPEGPWLFGQIGHFPTCLAPGSPGTQELVCSALSTPPGPTGYMRHVQSGNANYWLGCFESNIGELYGIDSESDGLFGFSGTASACAPSEQTDCEEFIGIRGDECTNDGSDGDVEPDFVFAFICSTDNNLRFSTANCGPARTAYLNVLCDLNFDGDWNDTVPCVGGGTCFCLHTCYPEWVIKNVAIMVASGCQQHFSPGFGVPSAGGTAWTRISLTDAPVDDDYPWAGSANRPDGSYAGGETEDYAFAVSGPDPIRQSTWGAVKIRYH